MSGGKNRPSEILEELGGGAASADYGGAAAAEAAPEHTGTEESPWVPPSTSLVPKPTQKPTSKRTCRYSPSHIPDPEVGREGQRADGTPAKRASMLPLFNFNKRTKNEG